MKKLNTSLALDYFCTMYDQERRYHSAEEGLYPIEYSIAHLFIDSTMVGMFKMKPFSAKLIPAIFKAYDAEQQDSRVQLLLQKFLHNVMEASRCLLTLTGLLRSLHV